MNISKVVSMFAAVALLPSISSAAGPVGQWDGCWDGTASDGLATGIPNTLTMVGTNVYVGGASTSVSMGLPVKAFLEKYMGSGRWAGLSTTSPYASGEITAMVSSGQNLYAVGGQFGLYTITSPTIATRTARGIAKWTGSAWVNVGTLIPVSSSQVVTINAMAIDKYGRIYVGGSFTNIGGVSGATNIVYWDGGSWKPLLTGLPGVVKAIAVAPNGDVYVGGQFTVSTRSSVAANNIVCWSWGSQKWVEVGGYCQNYLSFTQVYGVNSAVNTIAFGANNDVYLGGAFTVAYYNSSTSTAANHVVKINGATSTALGAGVNGNVNSLLYMGSSVYAGGSFTTAGGLSANNIAKWSSSAWSALDTGVNGEVKAVTGYTGNIYVAGKFTKAGATTTTGGARWYGAAD